MCYLADYRCRLRNGIVFEQKGSFTVSPTPRLTVTPIRRNVECQAGQSSQTQVECCVQEPYRVILVEGSETLQGTGEAPPCKSNMLL